jgi:hypothetical protein
MTNLTEPTDTAALDTADSLTRLAEWLRTESALRRPVDLNELADRLERAGSELADYIGEVAGERDDHARQAFAYEEYADRLERMVEAGPELTKAQRRLSADLKGDSE